MMNITVALISGGLFGTGLLVAGVTDTRTVQGWLDLGPDWDPTLGLFFLAAILPVKAAWWFMRDKKCSLLGVVKPTSFQPKVDRYLVLGAALFGVGWGMTGICPGPSLVAISYGGFSSLTFFSSMVAGMLIVAVVRKRQRQTAQMPQTPA